MSNPSGGRRQEASGIVAGLRALDEEDHQEGENRAASRDGGRAGGRAVVARRLWHAARVQQHEFPIARPAALIQGHESWCLLYTAWCLFSWIGSGHGGGNDTVWILRPDPRRPNAPRARSQSSAVLGEGGPCRAIGGETPQGSMGRSAPVVDPGRLLSR